MATANTQDALSDDLNYETWAQTTKTTMIEKGLWDVVENGVPPDPSKIPELAATIQAEELSKWRDLAVKDTKALQILQSSLSDSSFKKTLSSSSAKDVWNLLKKGNKEATVSRLQKQFEELKSKSEKCCDVCYKNSHNQEDCKKRIVVEYKLSTDVSLGYLKYDKDIWMIYESAKATIHMTPYEKYFTTLDITHRAKVELADGRVIMVQGRGDVKIMMKGGKKKTIKNVLFVPKLNKNVLSLSQMRSRGYLFEDEEVGKYIIPDWTGEEFGETMMRKYMLCV